jgi:hypothetical protein
LKEAWEISCFIWVDRWIGGCGEWACHGVYVVTRPSDRRSQRDRKKHHAVTNGYFERQRGGLGSMGDTEPNELPGSFFPLLLTYTDTSERRHTYVEEQQRRSAHQASEAHMPPRKWRVVRGIMIKTSLTNQFSGSFF